VFLLVLLSFSIAQAQSGQYKREKPKEVTKKSGKIDIKNLEEQYWTPQDREFKVVQNRKYSKKGKLGIALQFGIQSNDPYTESFGSTSAIFSYYWSEFKGVELNYTSFNSEASEVVDRFVGSIGGGTSPNYALLDSYIGVNFNWVPIYGKMSVLDNKIIYFDLAISPGLGITNYEPQKQAGANSESASTLSLDISQHFFFTDGWAIRLDMKNRAYEEDRVNWTSGVSAGSSSRVVTFWQMGLTYYLDFSPSSKKGQKNKAEKKKKGKK